jgi:ferritin-like protein
VSNKAIKIRAQLFNDNSGELIREFYYDVTKETLQGIMERVEKYVLHEQVNVKTPVRITVQYYYN